MTNFYSLVSAHITDERESFYLDVQLNDLKLSIGWGEVNPINKTPREIKGLIETAYPDFVGTPNPENGANSLFMFANLQPADVIFVRSNAKIIDVVIINGTPFYDRLGHYPNDYFLKVPFVPLFSAQRTSILTKNIPKTIYNDVVYEGGRSLPMKQISEDVAKELLATMLRT